MSHIKKSWDSYNSEVLPLSAPKIQRDECEQAFYAGALSLFHTLKMAPTDSVGAFTIFEAVHAELEEYVARKAASAERSGA